MFLEKKVFSLVCTLVLFCSLCACAALPGVKPDAEQPSSVFANEPPDASDSWPVHLDRSAVALQPARYIPIEQAGSYNTQIITPALLSKPSTLPEASVSSIPYWTGFVSDNMAWVNFKDSRWDYLTNGSNYFYEDNVRIVAQEGFNCFRALYSLSHLSGTDDPRSINQTQLECLDELISWGLTYDIHIMLSITGLPGKAVEGYESLKYRWPNELLQMENVQSNDELFTNPETASLYKDYMAMLVARYKDIPAKNLSFELLAEPAVPDGDVTLYENVLLPVVKTLKEIDDTRILIVNDVYKQVPERLAAAGCALSLHDHIYTVEASILEPVAYRPTWPMQYLPGVLQDPEKPLIFRSDSGFEAGTVHIYIDHHPWSREGLLIAADGKTILDTTPAESGWLTADLPAGVKELTLRIKNHGHLEFSAVKLEQQGKPELLLVRHDLYTGEKTGDPPTIGVSDDGTVQNLSGQQLDKDFFYASYLKRFIEVADRYQVGFLMTEVGTDTYTLSKEDYIAYHSVWLDLLREHNIPWMYNCLHGVLAPQGSVRTDVQYACGFTEIREVPKTPFEMNTEVFEFLRTFG